MYEVVYIMRGRKSKRQTRRAKIQWYMAAESETTTRSSSKRDSRHTGTTTATTPLVRELTPHPAQPSPAD